MKAQKAILLVLLALLSFAYNSLAQAPSDTRVSSGKPAETLRSEIESAKTLAPRKGERCIVCGLPLSEDDSVLLVRGRRLPLINSKENRAKLLAQPEKYFSQLQPRGAWFSESLKKPEASYILFFFGIVIIVLLVSAGLSAHAALCRGEEAEKWFFRGLYGSFAAVVCAYKSGERKVPWNQMKIASTVSPEPCVCGSFNHPSATACGSCAKPLEPSYESEARKTLQET